ncbi:MAG: hypothetical protein IJ859_05705 [Synergistaceae bacterium]|nr:hypothetical protein [Synergistaceae bacterium]
MKIDAVIMAKSTMWGNFCVAGIDVETGAWVRFVAFETGEPLADFNLMFVNAPGSCEVLDVGRIGIARRVPKNNHTEDLMIKYTPWLKMGRMKLEEVFKIHEPENHKFIFGTPRNYVDVSEMQRLKLNYSLILIKVENLKISFVENFHGDIRGRADFIYNDVEYTDIRVTDPYYEFNDSLIKNYYLKTDAAYLVMSMPSKPFEKNGKYYKLIAKIFPARVSEALN